MTTWRGKIRPERRGCLPQEELDRAMFTRLALTALTGMSGRLLRRPRSRARRREMAAGTATTASGTSIGHEIATPAESNVPLSATTAAQTQSSPQVGATTAAPGHVRPRANAPLLAAIAARSLPILGVIGTLATLLLAVGAVRGELPYVGPFESASPAWAMAMI